MKKLFQLGLALLLVLGLFLPTQALSSKRQYVSDQTGILSTSELEKLNEKYEAVSKKYEMDVGLVIISSSYSKSMQDYADDYYDENGFSKDGLLLVHAIDSRKWHITTTGRAISIFTDAGLDYMGEKLKAEFKEGNYYKAYELFASMSDDFIKKGLNGAPYDKDNLPRNSISMLYIGIGVLVSLVLAFVFVHQLKGQMQSVNGRIEANDYMNAKSLKITRQWDRYLYSKVTKTARPKDNSSSSSGSSTHQSSSGTTHGGRGGSY